MVENSSLGHKGQPPLPVVPGEPGLQPDPFVHPEGTWEDSFCFPAASSLRAFDVAQVREQRGGGPRRETAPEKVSVVGPDPALALIAAEGERQGHRRRVVGVSWYPVGRPLFEARINL